MIKVITLLTILMAGNAFAGGTEQSPFPEHATKPLTYTECMAGHLFAIVATENSVSIMQIFKDAGDMVPKPVECDVTKKETSNEFE